MDKIKKVLFCLSLFIIIHSLYGISFNVQAKSRISYTLKKGTLTISGKGMMPENKTFKKNNKIKKVIIKDGITSISAHAFEDCKNLKYIKLPKTIKRIGCKSFYNTSIENLTIPEGVEVIGEGAFNTCNYIKAIKMPGHGFYVEPHKELPFLAIMDEDFPFEPMITFKAKTIIFTNSLPPTMEVLAVMDTSNYVVSKNDPEYSSKKGVIYTKDFTRTVRLPNRKKVVICEGCKIFEMASYWYTFMESEDGWMSYNYYHRIANVKTRKNRIIILPKSLEYITDKSYEERHDMEGGYGYYNNSLTKIIIKSDKLSKKSIKILKDEFKYHPLKKGKVKIELQY